MRFVEIADQFECQLGNNGIWYVSTALPLKLVCFAMENSSAIDEFNLFVSAVELRLLLIFTLCSPPLPHKQNEIKTLFAEY